jgi:IS30 family transposase
VSTRPGANAPFFSKRRPAQPAAELACHLGRLGWSNRRLAEAVGVHQNTVSRWLHRHTSPPPYVLMMLRRKRGKRGKRA